MADSKVIAAQLRLDAEKAGETVSNFKKELKQATQDLQLLSEKFGVTSKEAADAARRVAELKDKIGDAKQLADGFNPDRKFQAFGNAIKGVAGGFTLLTGSMALFGDQSEDTKKTLLKVQAALAITEGINNVLELKDTFKALSAVIQNTSIFQKAYAASTALAATVTKAFGIAVETTSTGFKALRAAIIATGIGALVVGIGALVSAITDWIGSSESAKEAQDRLKKSIQELDESTKNYQQTIQEDTRLNLARAKAVGASEKEIYNIQLEGLKKNKQLLQGTLNDKYEYLQKLEKYRDQDGEGEKNYQEAKKNYMESYKEYNKSVNDIEILGLDRQAELRKKAIEDAKKASEKAKEAAKKLEEQNKQAREREIAALDQLQKAKEENNVLRTKDETEAAIKKAKYEAADAVRKINELKVNENIKTALIVEAEKKRDFEIDKILKEQKEKKEKAFSDEMAATSDRNHKILQGIIDQNEKENQVRQELADAKGTSFDKERADLEKWYDEKYKIVQHNELLLADLNEEYEKRKTMVTEHEHNMRLQVIGNLLGAAADLVGKQTTAGKVLAIAQATINTWAGATEALRAKSVLPEPFGTIQKIASVASIVATGLNAVKNIAKTPVPGGGGGGSVPSSVGAPLTPSISPAQQTSSLLDQQYLYQKNNAAVPVQAYVVESQGADARERITRVNRAARLG